MANARRRTSVAFIAGLLSALLGIVLAKIESAHAFNPIRKLHHFGVRERAQGVVVAALPVLFHRSAGKFEVLGNALVASGAIDQVDDIADFIVYFPFENSCILTVAKLLRNPLQEVRHCVTKLLGLLVVIGCGAGPA